MEKELTKEEAEKKLKTQLKMLELQAQVFDEKINKLKKKLRDLKKEKEQKLGGNYTDDTTVRPFIDIQ